MCVAITSLLQPFRSVLVSTSNAAATIVVVSQLLSHHGSQRLHKVFQLLQTHCPTVTTTTVDICCLTMCGASSYYADVYLNH